MVSYYRPELGLPEMGLVGRQLWQQSALKPTDPRAKGARLLLSRGFSEDEIAGALDEFFGPEPW